MSKNKSASAQSAKKTKAAVPAKKAAKKDEFIVWKDFTIGDHAYVKGDVFNVPAGWERNTHQEGMLNKQRRANTFCFTEVLLKEEDRKSENYGQPVRSCTHMLPLAKK